MRTNYNRKVSVNRAMRVHNRAAVQMGDTRYTHTCIQHTGPALIARIHVHVYRIGGVNTDSLCSNNTCMFIVLQLRLHVIHNTC